MKIGSGSIVLKEVPPGCTVVGIPGKVVKRYGESTEDLNQVNLPDPIAAELEYLRRRIKQLESRLDQLSGESEKGKEDEDI